MFSGKKNINESLIMIVVFLQSPFNHALIFTV